jgi:hypothetical protein
MKVRRLVVLTLVLFSAVILAGCHEGHAHGADGGTGMVEQVEWRQTQTGFWGPKIVYVEADYSH